MTDRRQLLRDMGLCNVCGGSLDRPDKYVRCFACREKNRESLKKYREAERERKESGLYLTPNALWVREMVREAEARRMGFVPPELQKCIKCERAKIEDSILFCPFMEGICMKGAKFDGKTDADQGQRTAHQF